MGISPLAALGFGELSQQVYAIVLRNPGMGKDDLSWMTGVTAHRVEAAVVELRRAGLVRVERDAISPHAAEDALARLIDEQDATLQAEQAGLAEARRAVSAFVADHAPTGARHQETLQVEVISEPELVDRLPTLLSSTTGELLWMRPDQWQYDEARRTDALVRDLVSEGRPSRAIYPVRAVELAAGALRARADSGEQVRLLATVPTRMAIFGTSLAVLPRRLGTDADRVLMIRQEALVESLRLLFEHLWAQALALPGLGAVNEGDRRLFLQQLAAGIKDEQIARNLGVSLRTVRRRVAALLEELGAESRFQAGMEAVRRGWM